MTIRVLCVDGDPVDRERTVEEIERCRPAATVVTNVSAEAGLDRLSSDRNGIDAVVSEYALPEMDGLDFLRAVREDDPDLPFVLFTNDGDETVASEAIAAGVTDYVRKTGDPDAYETLAERTSDAIETARSRTTARALTAAIDDAVIVYDPADDGIVDVNDRACDYLGCSYETARQTAIDTLDRDETSATDGADGRSTDGSLRERMERTIEEGPRRFEWRCETRDGDAFWADVILEPITVGSRDRVVAILRDVSEYKERERELRTFKRAVEHAGHSIYITDVDGTIEYVNPAFEKVTGYDREDAVGETPRILKSGEHPQAFYVELWNTILEGRVWNNEIVNERADGTQYVINQTIAPITENGEVVRFVAVNDDITEHKEREWQFRALHDATRRWLGSDAREVVVADAVGHMRDMLGFELHGIYLYDPAADVLAPAAIEDTHDLLDEHPTFERGDGAIWTAYESGEPTVYDDVRDTAACYNPETPIRSEMHLPLGEHGVLMVGDTEAGAFDDVEVTLAKVTAANLEGVLDRIENERELERQNDRLETFASVVSHDLRNPLNVAQGNLKLLSESDSCDGDRLETIENAHERIERIIDDLLWLAQEGREVGTLAPVSVASIAHAAWEIVPTADATLEVAVDPDTTVRADRDRLQQLFENLFGNAIEHAGEGVLVRVGTVDDGLYVEDTGPGIPPEMRDRIFEAGYTTSDDGTGLGLSIVQAVVDGHGWNVAVEESETGGARFEIRDVEMAT